MATTVALWIAPRSHLAANWSRGDISVPLDVPIITQATVFWTSRSFQIFFTGTFHEYFQSTFREYVQKMTKVWVTWVEDSHIKKGLSTRWRSAKTNCYLWSRAVSPGGFPNCKPVLFGETQSRSELKMDNLTQWLHTEAEQQWRKHWGLSLTLKLWV